MTESTMVERVARAIAQADEQNGGPPYDLRIQNKHSKEALFDEARAAIAAMEVPTEHMTAIGACYEDPDDRYAGEVELGIKDEGDIANDIYRAMIQAALKEQEQEHG